MPTVGGGAAGALKKQEASDLVFTSATGLLTDVLGAASAAPPGAGYCSMITSRWARRFWARPCALLLSAIGRSSP